MTRITRRRVLTGAGAAAVAAATAAATAPLAGTEVVEPLLAMEQKWLAFAEYYENYPDQSEEQDNRLFDELLDLQYRILLTEAKSPAGVAVKLRMHCRNNCWAKDDYTDPRPEDVGRGGGSLEVLPLKAALRDLERLAGEARS